MKEAYDRNYTFLCAHKKSIIHELDRSFIDQLYTTQRQLHFVQEQLIHDDHYCTIITDLKNRLTIIEEKYHKNSPALALLGPIGSAAIIAKEELLEQKLLIIINDISKILHTMCKQPFNNEAQTIDEGLQINKQLIHLVQ
jgi:hypothetical protein